MRNVKNVVEITLTMLVLFSEVAIVAPFVVYLIFCGNGIETI